MLDEIKMTIDGSVHPKQHSLETNINKISRNPNFIVTAHAASQTKVLHMKRLNQTESPIFEIFCVFFVSKGNPFLILFYSTVAGVVPCGCRKKSPRTSSECRLYFISFGIIEPILVILKVEYRLSLR